MTTEHKHAELLHAIADGNDIEILISRSKDWRYADHDWLFEAIVNGTVFGWRIKAKTIRIGEYDVPEPMRVAPKVGVHCFVAHLVDSSLYDWFIWADNAKDYLCLEQGICHYSEDEAILHSKALLSFTAKA